MNHRTSNQMDFRGKRVTVVGLARSGFAACKVLAARGASVLATDRSPAEKLRVSVAELLRCGVRIETGGHSPQSFLETDLLVISPGVDGRLPLIEQARSKGIPVWGEVELAYRLTSARFIGITGTKGKGTTATLLGEILRQGGKDAVVAGNIGLPLCEVVPSLSQETWVVAELSSFQLEEIVTFRPRIALLLNLAPDHLDRYPDVETYYAAKKRLLENQSSDDVVVLNSDSASVLALARGSRARPFHFSQRGPVGPGAFLRDDCFFLEKAGGSQKICARGELPVPGPGIVEDALAALAVANSLGVAAEPMAEALHGFHGRPHCLELVGEVGGVRYVNDSKATNVFAVRRALEAMEDPVILIAGGRDKREDFRPLAPLVRRRVKALILMGEAKEKILVELGGCCPAEEAAGMADAVERANRRATSGDAVLMSPGCTSFDMFQSAEERGDAFRRAVREMLSRRLENGSRG
jgi:UDP-N-acetylmuramoylalanine--D-glutamate ligase